MRRAEREFKTAVAVLDNDAINIMLEFAIQDNNTINRKVSPSLAERLLKRKNEYHIKWLRDVLGGRGV
jgi:hypothetical protein